ncbi:DNA-directed RNA polymerase subunit alpha [bacterium]|nr:DNA-directed RNA polymerase subunit alpha [bacterium]
MGIKWKDFEIPKKLVTDEKTLSDTYGKFIAEPLERGFGTTFGNSLRRIILSSIEGAAVIAVKIDGVEHEFSSLENVVEDVPQIILNIRNLVIKMDSRENKTLIIDVNKEGDVTAADIKKVAGIEILNPDLHIATLSKKRKFYMELLISKGRGFVPTEKNKEKEAPIGLIFVDTVFSPVKRVNFTVENTRVGQMTDYDKLIIEIWTNGSVLPQDALSHGAAIWRKYLDIFEFVEEEVIEEVIEENMELSELESKLNKEISELELSVRSANCLKDANIRTIKDLVTKSESEMLKYRNFGKRSLNEINEILSRMDLSLNMKIDQMIKSKKK